MNALTERLFVILGVSWTVVGFGYSSLGRDVSEASRRRVGAEGPRTEMRSAFSTAQRRVNSSGDRLLFLSQNVSFSICRTLRRRSEVERGVAMETFATLQSGWSSLRCEDV